MSPVDVTDHLNSNLVGATCASCAGDYIRSSLTRHGRVMREQSLVLRVTTMDMEEMDFTGADRIYVA